MSLHLQTYTQLWPHGCTTCVVLSTGLINLKTDAFGICYHMYLHDINSFAMV